MKSNYDYSKFMVQSNVELYATIGRLVELGFVLSKKFDFFAAIKNQCFHTTNTTIINEGEYLNGYMIENSNVYGSKVSIDVFLNYTPKCVGDRFKNKTNNREYMIVFRRTRVMDIEVGLLCIDNGFFYGDSYTGVRNSEMISQTEWNQLTQYSSGDFVPIRKDTPSV